jgi:hypothetical protein
MYSKHRIILALTFLLVLTIPFAADGILRVTMGEIQGLNCAMKGLTCPADRMDVHVATEPDFVLVKTTGSHSMYHLLPNLPRDVKVRYVGESAIVTGDLRPKDNSILVDKFEIRRGMFHGIVWTKEMQQQEKGKAGP